MDKVRTTVKALVYIGDACLLHFPTNDEAWAFLSALSLSAYEQKQVWFEEKIHVVMVMYTDDHTVAIPQIGRIIRPDKREEDQYVKYVNLVDAEYHIFARQVVDDWSRIKEALNNG